MSAFSERLHTEKSDAIRLYRPLYPETYDVNVGRSNPDNIARVIYRDGRALALQGEKYGVNFLKLETPELKRTVENILSGMESKRQENLWRRLGLGASQRLFPIQGSKQPYFSLDKNNIGIFAYCPLAADQVQKFAFIIPDSFGLFKTGADGRYFGAYSNDLKSTLGESYFHLDDAKIAAALCDSEPAAVWGYEEDRVLKKLDQMTRETNARPFLFSTPGGKPLVSLPEEAHDYLSPAESELAKKLIVLQESAGEASEHAETEAPALRSPEDAPAEDADLQMTL